MNLDNPGSFIILFISITLICAGLVMAAAKFVRSLLSDIANEVRQNRKTGRNPMDTPSYQIHARPRLFHIFLLGGTIGIGCGAMLLLAFAHTIQSAFDHAIRSTVTTVEIPPPKEVELDLNSQGTSAAETLQEGNIYSVDAWLTIPAQQDKGVNYSYALTQNIKRFATEHPELEITGSAPGNYKPPINSIPQKYFLFTRPKASSTVAGEEQITKQADLPVIDVERSSVGGSGFKEKARWHVLSCKGEGHFYRLAIQDGPAVSTKIVNKTDVSIISHAESNVAWYLALRDDGSIRAHYILDVPQSVVPQLIKEN
jgi:hypothetical protein